MTRKRFKLTIMGPLVIGSILILSFSIVLIVSLRVGSTIAQQSLIDNGRATLSVSARLLFNPLYNLDVEALHRILDGFLKEPHIVHAGVRDVTGQIITEDTEGQVLEEQAGRDLAAQALAQQDIVQREIEGYLVMSGPIGVGSEAIGTLEIVFEQSSLRGLLDYARNTMSIVMLVVLVGTALIIAVLIRRATVTLGALVAAAGEIGRGNLNVTVPIGGSEETAVLGIALERMRTDLEELYRNLEQQIATLEEQKQTLEVQKQTLETQKQTLEAQQQTIQELASPVIPIMERVIAMPLVGNMDSMRAREITRSLLAAINQYRAKVVILDITGVPIVDSAVANHLNKTIQAARLKGAHTIITGISDAVAETIVDLGIDWGGIDTLPDLQTGLVVALASLGIRLSR